IVNPHVPFCCKGHWLWIAINSARSCGFMRRGFRTGTFLKGMILATGCPPQGKGCGRVGGSREKLQGGRRGAQQEDVGELRSVACEQSEEHHPRGLHARP